MAVDYSIADPMLARRAMRDLGIDELDLIILRKLANAGADEAELEAYIKEQFPGWERRPDSYGLILRVLKRGVDLETVE